MKKLEFTAANRAVILSYVCLILICCSCHPKSFKDENTPTTGKLNLGVDESYKLLLDTELYTFLSIYSNAHIYTVYKPELDILKDFLNDSLQVMVTSRKLTSDEEKYLNSKRIFSKTTLIAYDAVTLIVNTSNPDSLIRYNDVKGIFTGDINNWHQLNPKSKPSDLKVVFDSEKSGNVRYFVEKFKLPNKLPGTCYAVNSNEEVVNYVQKHSNALGILSVNWVSDKNDSLSGSFLKRIKVVAISSEYNSDGEDFYRPYQGYIADKSYPFIRDVYMISREYYLGLGSGFIAFVAGETGQRIILKSKLVPATMPVRFVHLKKNITD